MAQQAYDKIPVHIITGFLGAGKTTFLNQLMKARPQERLLVIENEVGKANIDSRLLVGAALDVVELTAGCLCCSLNDDLLDVLEAVSARRDEFDRLVIETTGIANPETLVLPFLAYPAVERVFELQGVLCLVDAENVEGWLRDTEEARRQIAFADVLLLNKTDLVTPQHALSLAQLLASINPYAALFAGQDGGFPMDELMAIRGTDAGQTAQRTALLPITREHQHQGISTFTLSFDRPFDLDGLSRTLVQLLHVNQHQIYRIKGIINARDYPVQVVLQSVRDKFHLSDGELWDPASPRESKIVFIGKDIQRAPLEHLFSRHLLAKA